MQLYAKDGEGKDVFAAVAAKQHDYHCRECHGIVRVRGGPFRHRHFYHLQTTRSCSSSGKSLVHLQVQHHLRDLLPPQEAYLEHQFPSIGRIADVCWESRKLIFEIQCSGISAEEIRKRNEDYGSLGFQVIWILHDSRFNQHRFSAAEDALKVHPFYFTNMDEEGAGVIYDQFSLAYRGVRKEVLSPLPVNLADPKPMAGAQLEAVFNLVKMRQACWPYYFGGDILDCYIKNREIPYLEKIGTLEQSLKFSSPKRCWYEKLLYFYRMCFQIALEKACKR